MVRAESAVVCPAIYSWFDTYRKLQDGLVDLGARPALEVQRDYCAWYAANIGPRLKLFQSQAESLLENSVIPAYTRPMEICAREAWVISISYFPGRPTGFFGLEAPTTLNIQCKPEESANTCRRRGEQSIRERYPEAFGLEEQVEKTRRKCLGRGIRYEGEGAELVVKLRAHLAALPRFERDQDNACAALGSSGLDSDRAAQAASQLKALHESLQPGVDAARAFFACDQLPRD